MANDPMPATDKLLRLEIVKDFVEDQDVTDALNEVRDLVPVHGKNFKAKFCSKPELYATNGANLADAIEATNAEIEADNAKILAKLEAKLAAKGTKANV